uniref:CWF19-like protein 1 n=1 Tax=Aceria tosichella TaxID=561515 RepID=A0A6G1SA01_9ACAR
MSTSAQNCIYCSKECKPSDSKPYPGSKSKERIHNRCQIKKTLASKQKETHPSDCQTNIASIKKTPGSSTFDADLKTPAVSLMEKMIEDKEKRQQAAKLDKINQIISEREAQAAADRSSGSFFFDVKAGIAKPHEKRQYLHHRNICEIAPRYNDHGYQEDTIGRAYDPAGKDLNTLGDDSDDDEVKPTESAGKRKASSSFDTPSGFDTKKRTQTVRVDDANPCWFCLSSPIVEKHLIIAIGENCYLTLAKGGLVDEHFLLLPIEHIPSVSHSSNSTELLHELENFKNSLIRYFGSQSMGVIFYERNFRSVHWQIQVVPIRLDELDDLVCKIKSISKIHFAKSEYIDIPKNCSINDIVPRNAPYLYWQIEPLGQRFIYQIEVKDSFFPVQLPRKVLADEKIMNCLDRVDWKRCSKSKDEYVDLVKRIKMNYQQFDIT